MLSREGDIEKREGHANPLPATRSSMPPALAPEGANAAFDSSTQTPGKRLPPVFFVDRAGPSYRDADPPDPQIAAGPRHLLIGVNKLIRVCDKSGTSLREVLADDWHASVLANVFSFDPIVAYDHFAGRWLMLWIHAGTDTLTSYFLLSVSDTDDPLGGWSIWALPADVNGSAPSGDYPDHEGMGFDSTTIVIASNQYDYASPSVFTQVKLRVIAKSQLLGPPAGPVQWTDFWALREPSGSRAFNIRPANHYTQSAAFSLAGMPNAIVAIVLQCIVALLLVTFVLAGVQATGVYILIFLYLAGLGSLSPNTTAIAIGPFTHRAGTASALLGSMQMAAGAIGSSLVSFFHNGTAMPMAVLLLSASLGSLGLQFGYRMRSGIRSPAGG
jgi:hypothetical protein